MSLSPEPGAGSAGPTLLLTVHMHTGTQSLHGCECDTPLDVCFSGSLFYFISR